MYLPKIVSGSAQERVRCKFERRLLACLLVPSAGCSRSCQETSPNRADEPMVLGSSTGLRPPRAKESCTAVTDAHRDDRASIRGSYAPVATAVAITSNWARSMARKRT
jgi:hypothetical protein